MYGQFTAAHADAAKCDGCHKCIDHPFTYVPHITIYHLFVDALPSGWSIAVTPFVSGASENGSTSVY